jgi:hypothetical protein
MTHSNRFITTEAGSDLMCYDTDKDEVHILNSTALTIRRLLSEGKTEEQIVKILRASPHAPEESEVAADVRACRETLFEKGLIDARQAR